MRTPNPRHQTASFEAALLQPLIRFCSSDFPPSRTAVEEALERGAGKLLALEAALLHGKARGSDWQACVDEIELLRGLLDELRVRATRGAVSPLAHGFVSALHVDR